MKADALQALIHLVAVTGGLFVLWSLIGAMRNLSAAQRFGAALAAGSLSGAVVLIVRVAS